MRGTRKSRSDFGFGRDAEEWSKDQLPKVMRIVARLAALRPGPHGPSFQRNRATSTFLIVVTAQISALFIALEIQTLNVIGFLHATSANPRA